MHETGKKNLKDCASWCMRWQLFDTKEYIFFLKKCHFKFYVEDSLQNPKIYNTYADKHKNMYLISVKISLPILFLSSLELSQRFRISRYEISAVIKLH